MSRLPEVPEEARLATQLADALAYVSALEAYERGAEAQFSLNWRDGSAKNNRNSIDTAQHALSTLVAKNFAELFDTALAFARGDVTKARDQLQAYYAAQQPQAGVLLADGVPLDPYDAVIASSLQTIAEQIVALDDAVQCVSDDPAAEQMIEDMSLEIVENMVDQDGAAMESETAAEIDTFVDAAIAQEAAPSPAEPEAIPCRPVVPEGWLPAPAGRNQQPPVDGSVRVDVLFHNGVITEGEPASTWGWGYDPDQILPFHVIGYRLAAPAEAFAPDAPVKEDEPVV